MRLRIYSKNLAVPDEMRRAMERNVRLNLGRHTSGIDTAQITLSPAVPVRDAHSYRCRIEVHLRKGVEFAIESHAEDLCAAAAEAAWRLRQRLDRQLANRLRIVP